MKERKYDYLVIIVCALVLIGPLVIGIAVFSLFNICVFTNHNFWSSYMTYFGTVMLASISLYQSIKSRNLSTKFDEINAKQNYSIGFAEKFLKFEIIPKNDRVISIETNYEKYADALHILCDDCRANDTSALHYCYLTMKFKDNSKSTIENMILDVNQMCIIQKPSDGGLSWSDNSDDNIQIGFIKGIKGDKFKPTWISKDEYQIHFKIYYSSGGVFDSMIHNKAYFVLIFSLTLNSIGNVSTKMKYKYGIENNNNGICVDYVTTRLIETNL